jgi:hypothetical protein
MEYIVSGTRMYPDNPRTYTRCQETSQEGYRIGVGGFGSGGFSVYFLNRYYGRVYDGVGPLREF